MNRQCLLLFTYPIIAALVLASVPSCSRPSNRRTVAAPTEVAKVRVSADGKIYFNERLISFDGLRAEFQRLKRIDGAVQFIDETGASHQQVQAVRKAISEAQLPIRVLSPHPTP
jgi:biopolymer transport protein ExbD